MKKVLVLGAGMVARPLVRYLLDLPGVAVTVATRTTAKAEAMIDGHGDGTALALDATDTNAMAELIAGHDLSVSLLPPPLHPVVAGLCVENGKHMVTTSYASPAMRALDAPARDAGLIIVNEVGVDPGLDHMSAMRVIDRVKAGGGEILGFKSYCGGLPAPDANDNPFGYKFSWSPRGVFTAARNDGCYLEDGKVVSVPARDLFVDFDTLAVTGLGDLEAHPNRDSREYIDIYGLAGIGTMYRGTLRYPGWCDTLKAIVDLDMLDLDEVTYPDGSTYGEFIAGQLPAAARAEPRRGVAEHLGLSPNSPVLDNLDWLGLFGDDVLPDAGQTTTRLDIVAARMGELMPYRPGERDMLVLVHEFTIIDANGGRERITATMVDYGEPGGDSSMARTVGLPAAIAVKMVLNGEFASPGLHIPVTPDLYDPILDELSALGIGFDERSVPA